jgi:hypothetical protein
VISGRLLVYVSKLCPQAHDSDVPYFKPRKERAMNARRLFIVLCCSLLAVSGLVAQNPYTGHVLVVGARPVTGNDSAVVVELRNMGFTVDTSSDVNSAGSMASGKKFVYVSSSSTSGNIVAKFKNATCPVLMLEGKATDEMAMCPGNTTAYQDPNQEKARPFVIVDNGYLSAGFSIGDTVRWVTDTTTGGQVQLIAPFSSGVGGATWIARDGDNPATSPYALLPYAWFYFETGDLLADGTTAAGRRYWGPWCDANFLKLSADGYKLWRAMIDWAMQFDTPTGVKVSPRGVPDAFSLEQNYPNPFNPSTTISFSLAATVHVRLAVYDLIGQNVASLLDENMDVGTHKVQFDAKNLSSGVYFYELRAGSKTFVRKMILMR